MFSFAIYGPIPVVLYTVSRSSVFGFVPLTTICNVVITRAHHFLHLFLCVQFIHDITLGRKLHQHHSPTCCNYNPCVFLFHIVHKYIALKHGQSCHSNQFYTPWHLRPLLRDLQSLPILTHILLLVKWFLVKLTENLFSFKSFLVSWPHIIFLFFPLCLLN